MFDPAIDAGSWTGASHVQCGEAWLGPLGLLARLELALGIGAASTARLDREIDLARVLRGLPGPWTRSFEADPIATAKRLLRDRDLLALWGWRGEPTGHRWDALWAATRDLPPGIPDRLHRVIARSARSHVEIAAIRMFEPITALSPLWRQTLAAVERSGVEIRFQPLAPHSAAGDLAASRGKSFTPTGDGSLQIVRAHGVLAAADEVAGTLAARHDLDGVVIVGPDALLDDALARHGIGRVGADIPCPASTALVRLCIETAFEPMDARELHALVCADPGPVPRLLASRLSSALAKYPGRGSILWREAMEAGLDAIADGVDAGQAAASARRETIRARLDALLAPATRRGSPLPLTALRSRLEALAGWARGRAASEPSLLETIALADRVAAATTRYGVDPIDRRELRRLCAELESPVASGPSAELGVASVAEPGAVLGPAHAIIWWDFTRARAPIAPHVRLTPIERAAFLAAGVSPPDPGEMMMHEARRWRRPLEQASETLVLVCPQTDEGGDAGHPHPMWDELVAASGPDGAACLRVPRMTLSGVVARRERSAARELPLPTDAVTTPAAIGLRTTEAASSLETLLGCSLAYALRYAGKLWIGMSRAAAAPSPLLFGELAHLVLARVFTSGALTPEMAAHRAAVIDDELPAIAETLWLPDHQADRASIRRVVVAAARLIAELLAETGATIRGTELELTGAIGTATVTGRPDLVLANPDHVLDLKWGASASRSRLVAGAAIQLAIYAELARITTLPGAAYLIVRDQRLLAARGPELPFATMNAPHSVGDMLEATRRAIHDRVRELATQQLVAPGAVDDVSASRLEDGVLRIAPPCAHCDLGGVCGRRARGGR